MVDPGLLTPRPLERRLVFRALTSSCHDGLLSFAGLAGCGEVDFFLFAPDQEPEALRAKASLSSGTSKSCQDSVLSFRGGEVVSACGCSVAFFSSLATSVLFVRAGLGGALLVVTSVLPLSSTSNKSSSSPKRSVFFLVVEDEESPNKSSSESLSNKDMLREVARLWSCTSILISFVVP